MVKINPEYALPQKNNIKPSESNNKETNVSVFNDKNGNGIVDRDDFSDEELEKLENNGLYRLFDRQKWTDNLKKIFNSIMSGGNTKDGIITDESVKLGLEKHVLYDSKTNTLKIASKNPEQNRYFSYLEYKYNNNGNLLESKNGTNMPHYGDLGLENADIYIRAQGFENENLQEKEVDFVNKKVADNEDFVFNKKTYKYDANGNKIESIYNTPTPNNGREEIITKKGENSVEIKYDKNNNFISKTKTIKVIDEVKSDGSSHTETMDETYDKDNNLQYHTTLIRDLNYNDDGDIIVKNVATREYTNGNVYNETYDGDTKKVELKDKNGNIIEKYTLQYNDDLKGFEKVFEDGSRKKADFTPLTD